MQASNENNGVPVLEWANFVAQEPSPDMFLRLVYIADGKFALATVLWDLLLHHRKQGQDAWRSFSAKDYMKTYGAEVCSERSYHNAFTDLSALGWIELDAGVRNTTRRFKLNWSVVSAELDLLSPALPGLVSARTTPVSSS